MAYSDLIAGGILFRGSGHLHFYRNVMECCGMYDERHQALFYCLGIEACIRQHVTDVFDFEEKTIQTDCLSRPWMDRRCAKVIRMAFNLYGSGMLDGELPECHYRRYTPDDLFCSSYNPYFWEAVRLRYPEYCRGGA